MKKVLFSLFLVFSATSVFAQTENIAVNTENPPSTAETTQTSDEKQTSSSGLQDSLTEDVADSTAERYKNVSHKSGISEVPAEKRPLKIEQKVLDQLENQYPDSKKGYEDTFKYGMEEDIIELIETLQKNEDLRFVDEIYDLFQVTKNSIIREKILDYFGQLKDPCLEDFCVMVLNDPFDEKKSTVNAVFSYIQKVKTVEAIPAVLTLIENEDESYFNSALATIGEIGGNEEAVFIAEFLEREDLALGQKQQLVKVLGKIKAVETFDSLVKMAEDTDENSYVRMYSAEAIGAMQKEEAVDVLVTLFEDADPKIRTYAIKGLTYFKDNEKAKETILQALRDSHVSVRLEAVDSVKENEYKEAVPFLIYRLEKEKEDSVKKKCFPAIAKLNTQEGNEYLIKQITDKKVFDNTKLRACQALLEYNNSGTDEIIELARQTLKDDRRKNLRYSLGKEFAKYGRPEFADICGEYIDSKDTATQGTGLDIFAKGRYEKILPKVRALVMEGTKTTKRNANAEKAERILGKKDKSVIEAEELRKQKEEEKEKKEQEKLTKENSKAQNDAK